MLEDHSGVIRAYAKGKKYQIALKKAVQFEINGEKLDLDVSAQQIASDFARMKVHEGDQESVRNIITFISDGMVKADFLKETGLFLEASEELRKEGKFVDAVRILKAQGMFKEGLESFKKEATIRSMFNLCIATQQIIEDQFFDDPLLNELTKCKDLYCKSRSELLCGKFKDDTKYLKRAIQSFKDNKDLPGRIIASYHSLIAQIEDNQLDKCEFLNAVKELNDAREATRAFIDGKATKKQRNFMHDVFRLYDIVEEETFYYTTKISRAYAKFTTDLDLEVDDTNIDGTLVLDKESVQIAIIAVFDQMHHTLSSSPFVKSQFKKLLHSLSTCNKDFHADSFKHYFDDVRYLFKFCTLFPDNELDGEDTTHVENSIFFMFSPFSETLSYLVLNINDAQSDFFLNIAFKKIDSPNSSLDCYFSVWAMLMIFPHSEGAIWRLKDNFKTKEKDGDGLVIPYLKKKTHVFFWWTYACRQFRDGKVIAGCNTVMYNLLYRFPQIKNYVSISSITFVVSQMTTMLVIAINSSPFSPLVKFIVPEVYGNACVTFGKLNNMNMSICSSTGVASNSFSQSIQQLTTLLDFMIGGDKGQVGILQMALSSEVNLNDGSAQSFLTLCLVLAANLYCYPDITHNMHPRLLIIQKELKRHRHHSFVDQAYCILQSAKNVGDIFSLITSLSSRLVCPLVVWKQIVFKPVPPGNTYPQIKRLVIIEDQKEQNDLQLDDDVDSTVTSSSNVTIENEYTGSPDFDDIDKETEEQDIKVEIKDGMLEDNECQACGTEFPNSKSHGQKVYYISLKSHFESHEHKEKVKSFKEFTEVMRDAEDLYKNVKKGLEKYREIVVNQSHLNLLLSRHKGVMEKIRGREQLFEWVNCIKILQKYVEDLQNLSIEKPNILALNDDDDDEMAEVNLLPPDEEEKWTKESKNARKWE